MVRYNKKPGVFSQFAFDICALSSKFKWKFYPLKQIEWEIF